MQTPYLSTLAVSNTVCEQAGSDLWDHFKNHCEDIKSGLLQNQLHDKLDVWQRKEGLTQF